MANSTIASIANTVAEGDNTIHSAILGETGKAGMGLYFVNSTGVKLIDGVENMVSGLAGVIKEHYATGNEDLSNGQSIEYVSKGYVPIFCDDPGKDIGPGAEFHGSGAVAGSFGWFSDPAALTGYRALGKAVKQVSNGDTVAHVKLYGG